MQYDCSYPLDEARGKDLTWGLFFIVVDVEDEVFGADALVVDVWAKSRGVGKALSYIESVIVA